MSRLLLILVFVCTGLAPSASCFYAAAAQPAVVAEDCKMACCGAACCCVTDAPTPASTPEAPATPPRPVDTAPTVLLLPASWTLDWSDPLDRPTYPQTDSTVLPGPTPRSVHTMYCRWLT
ncbi:hypothetical protein [Algisphaera agarilytica]|uniref:Secreted protein n=1 Tax=Algisphaera agarilytica TaxID=1385975 RepID=A0A7X0H6G7_9BACT|nr:hypothetical protein [Algisphaera agarilytica]MBB6430196.1 hypothetical protein [Algisphaera agarilytica]